MKNDLVLLLRIAVGLADEPEGQRCHANLDAFVVVLYRPVRHGAAVRADAAAEQSSGKNQKTLLQNVQK